MNFSNRFQGIPWAESIPGSPEEAFSYDGSQVMRNFFVNWADRAAAVKFWPGFVTLTTDAMSGLKYLSRTLPHQYTGPLPASVNTFLLTTGMKPFMWCTSIRRIEGINPGGFVSSSGPGIVAQDGSAVAQYSVAKLMARWENLTYDLVPDAAVINKAGPLQGFPSDLYANGLDSDGEPNYVAGRFLTVIPKASNRQLTLPRGMMRYVPSNVPVPEGLPITVFEQVITVTWVNVPRNAYPFQTILQAGGTVNQFSMFGYPPETLRLDDVTPRPRWDQLGNPIYEVQFTFRACARFNLQQAGSSPPGTINRGWNWVLQAVNGVLDFVEVTSNGISHLVPPALNPGTPPFRVFDQSACFRPGP